MLIGKEKPARKIFQDRWRFWMAKSLVHTIDNQKVKALLMYQHALSTPANETAQYEDVAYQLDEVI